MNLKSISALCSISAKFHLARAAAVLLSLLAVALPVAPALGQAITSAVPGLISYQGKISNVAGTLVGAGTPTNRKVVFRIWRHQSNSTVNDLVYSEEQTVTISEGEFSVLIGQGAAVGGIPLGYSESAKGPSGSFTVGSPDVFGAATRYLGVTIDDGDGNLANDPEISPRQQLVTSAFAFRAKYAESVGSNGANTITTLDNGNVGIGVSTPTTKLDVNGSIRLGGVLHAGLQLTSSTNSLVATVGVAGAAGAYSSDAALNDLVFRQEGGGKLLFQVGETGSGLAIGTNNFVGIGQPNPVFPLTFATTTGDKISLHGSTAGAGFYGFGVAAGLLKIHASDSGADIGFGHNSTGVFTEIMRIKGTGNVGIGQPSPAFPLTFATTTGDKISLHGTTAGAAHYGFGIGAGLLQIHSDVSAADIGFGYGASASFTEVMRIKGTGNVGIGTTSPTAKLHVNGSLTATSITTGSITLSGAVQASGAVNTHTQGAYLEWNKAAGVGATYLLNQKGGGTGGLIFGEVSTADVITERMRIDSVGNVGIGENAPGFPLNFASTVGDKISLYGNAGAHYGFGIGPGVLQIHSSAEAADVAFGYGSSTAFTETMRVKGNGNVGIGTTTPTAKLDVNGSYHMSGTGIFSIDSSVAFQVLTAGNVTNGTTTVPSTSVGTGGATSAATITGGRFHIAADGKIGIGTNTPETTLHIVNRGVKVAPFFRGARGEPASWGDVNDAYFDITNFGGTNATTVFDGGR